MTGNAPVPTPCRRPGLRHGLAWAALVAVLSSAPAHAELRGLLVGIDGYQNLAPLSGAVADAGDIATVLKGRGARDVVVLTDAAAGSKAIEAAVDALVRRTRRDDTVMLAFSGIGGTLAGPAGGSAMLLAGYRPGAPSSDLVAWSSILAAAARLEKAGAQVVVVNDFASGSEQARDTDIRAAGGALRGTAERIRAEGPVPGAAPELRRTVVLSAAAAGRGAAEVTIEGKGPRGALSYAVARGLEGAADADHDGAVSGTELADYVQLVSYQIADQRQRPDVTAGATLSRGISVQPVGSAKPPAPTTVPSPPPPQPLPSQPLPSPAGPQQQVRTDGQKIRVAALDGQGARLQRFVLPVPFEVVDARDKPDLVWDPGTKDVVSGGDVIARNVELNDMPGVIERTSVIRSLRTVVAKAPQSMRLLPGDGLHRKGYRVEIEVKALRSRSLILFNIAGNGAIQVLYPAGNDRNQFDQDDFRLPLSVSEPFGADQVVAVTAPQRLVDVEKAIRELERPSLNKAPGRVLDILAKLPPGAAVGTIGLFTAP